MSKIITPITTNIIIPVVDSKKFLILSQKSGAGALIQQVELSSDVHLGPAQLLVCDALLLSIIPVPQSAASIAEHLAGVPGGGLGGGGGGGGGLGGGVHVPLSIHTHGD